MDIIIGLQWGDEGKGKIVDYLSDNYDVICRFQGGPNAGHTLVINKEKIVLHSIPSGILNNKNSINIIGNGNVIDPIILVKEYKNIEKNAININKRLKISNKSHLILITHKMLDEYYENLKGENKIGSTKKGIGPTYSDKYSRIGIRIGDIFNENFKEKYYNLRNNHLNLMNNSLEIDKNQEDEWFNSIEYIKKNIEIINSELLILKNLEEKKRILAEGAQGSMLDIDFGSYPYVTSSNTISSGSLVGLGVASKHVKKVIGIFKAYTTRVGMGIFPTEIKEKIGETITKIGNEFGSTTGRQRRCGWLDLPLLKYAIDLNGVDELVIMKSDVLNNFDEIKVCVEYKYKGKFNPIDDLKNVEPIYKSFKSWDKVEYVDNKNKLNSNFLYFIEYIENYVKVPIKLISYGPEREKTFKI